ncbi:hypothetical protein FGG08_005657 [Glutinoglossum americanum]|uniref:Uncharacterized protein n=1 Tax=Glutinoglossum americanum TaxID=1670608 RepID=A0A9P8HZW9_9PEZI|nr:hypothetical protein FGG08_005657 [Glutinoglossum americanum]
MAEISSILGVAGAGIKLSLVLYEMASDIGSAGRDVNAIAGEMSLFSQGSVKVLRMVDKSLKGASVQFGSPVILEANAVLPSLVSQCQIIYKEANGLLDVLKPLMGESPFRKLGRVRWLFQKSRVQVLRGMLDSLKATVSLLVSTVDLEIAKRSKESDKAIEDLEAELKTFMKLAELKNKELDEVLNAAALAKEGDTKKPEKGSSHTRTLNPPISQITLMSDEDPESWYRAPALSRRPTRTVLNLARAVAVTPAAVTPSVHKPPPLKVDESVHATSDGDALNDEGKRGLKPTTGGTGEPEIPPLQDEGLLESLADQTHGPGHGQNNAVTAGKENLPESETELEICSKGRPLQDERPKLPKRIPKHSSGADTASLQKTLITAVAAQKHKFVEQLLDRGVSPDTGPENNVVIEATYHKDIATLKLLLEFGADPNAKATNGGTPLRCACQFNHEAEAKILLEYGADPNVSAPDWTPLPWALDGSKENIVRLLLQYGADPDLIMHNGETGLVYACDRNVLPGLVQEILDHGADPNVKNARGLTALYAACNRNHPEIVNILLSKGADPNLAGPELPVLAALHYPACLVLLISAIADIHTYKGLMERATFYNLVDAVKLLLDAGVDPNEKYQEVYSPITTAIRDNHPEIFSLLLSRGADPNLKGQDIPLAMAVKRPELLKQLIAGGADISRYKGLVERAVYHNSIESVEFLLDVGADPNERYDELWSPLTTAIRDDHPEIISLLLSRGADPNLEGQGVPLAMAVKRPELLKQLIAGGADISRYKGLIERAVYHNSIESVEFLLDAGVDPNEKRDEFWSPLTTAIRDDHPEVISLLLSRGADPNLKGQDVPLAMAVKRPELLKQLIAGGADISRYKGLIERAVYHNSIESVEFLLDAGVDPNEKRDEFWSPLTTAIRDDHPEIISLLLSRGADPNLEGQGVPLVVAIGKPALLKQLIAGSADVSKCKGLLELAVYHHCIESIQILLEAGAPIDEKRLDRYSPLTTAIRDNHIDIISLLLSRGADLNSPGEGLPITQAARFADPERLRIVLDAGADVNKQYNGRSALMQACESNAMENVKLLLRRGADVDAVDNGGDTAMDIAAKNGHDEIFMLFLDRVA